MRRDKLGTPLSALLSSGLQCHRTCNSLLLSAACTATLPMSHPLCRCCFGIVSYANVITLMLEICQCTANIAENITTSLSTPVLPVLLCSLISYCLEMLCQSKPRKKSIGRNASGVTSDTESDVITHAGSAAEPIFGLQAFYPVCK